MELLSRLKPEPYDDTLIPSPMTWARMIEMCAHEFAGRPRLADEFETELLGCLVDVLGRYIPRLGPGARDRLISGFRAIDQEDHR